MHIMQISSCLGINLLKEIRKIYKTVVTFGSETWTLNVSNEKGLSIWAIQWLPFQDGKDRKFSLSIWWFIEGGC